MQFFMASVSILKLGTLVLHPYRDPSCEDVMDLRVIIATNYPMQPLPLPLSSSILNVGLLFSNKT